MVGIARVDVGSRELAEALIPHRRAREADPQTGEIFYRISLIPNFALTPDYQLLIHPSLAPSRGSISVFSLRGRLTL
ncbi:MAG: carbohydrate porin [Candidatus Cybelea sp.]